MTFVTVHVHCSSHCLYGCNCGAHFKHFAKASSNKHKLCQATSEKVLIPDLQKKTSYMLQFSQKLGNPHIYSSYTPGQTHPSSCVSSDQPRYQLCASAVFPPENIVSRSLSVVLPLVWKVEILISRKYDKLFVFLVYFLILPVTIAKDKTVDIFCLWCSALERDFE